MRHFSRDSALVQGEPKYKSTPQGDICIAKACEPSPGRMQVGNTISSWLRDNVVHELKAHQATHKHSRH